MTDHQPDTRHRMPLHDVAWTLQGESIGAQFTCPAGPGAFCRLRCGEDCGAETYPCEDNDGRAHVLIDQGACNVLLFLEDADPTETYRGARTALRSGPIRPEWTGDHYTWQYADDTDDRQLADQPATENPNSSESSE